MQAISLASLVSLYSGGTSCAEFLGAEHVTILSRVTAMLMGAPVVCLDNVRHHFFQVIINHRLASCPVAVLIVSEGHNSALPEFLALLRLEGRPRWTHTIIVCRACRLEDGALAIRAILIPPITAVMAHTPIAPLRRAMLVGHWVRSARHSTIIRVLAFIELFFLQTIQVDIGSELERRNAPNTIISRIKCRRV